MTRPEMADEALFLLLHNEMVSGLYRAAEQGEGENGRCITKLENMGFRVGQGLIERFTKDTARFKDELDIMKFICKDFWTTVFKKQIDNLRTNHQILRSLVFLSKNPSYGTIPMVKLGTVGVVWGRNSCEKPWKDSYQLHGSHQANASFTTLTLERFVPKGIYVLQDNKFRLLTQMSAGKQYLEYAPKYLAFTCGLIRGGLSNLGIKSIVTAEVSAMPACKFQVMIQKI